MTIDERLQRLEQLEGRNSRWRLAALVLGGVLLGTIATSCSTNGPELPSETGVFTTLYAHRIEVLDDSVNLSILLDGGDRKSANAEDHGEDEKNRERKPLGSSTLAIYGPDRKPRVMLMANKEIGYIAAMNQKGRVAAELMTGEGEGGQIALYNSFEKPVATLQSDKTNRGALLLYDVNGKPKNGLSVQP